MSYQVFILENGVSTCTCQKPQLTGIPCDHVLAVCGYQNLDWTEYVNPYYNMVHYTAAWNGHFYSFGNPHEWQQYHGAIIRPDPTKVNKGRRRKIRISMMMDEMEGRISRLASTRQSRANEARQRKRAQAREQQNQQ